MRKILLVAFFVLPVLILLPHLNQFPFQPGGTFSDLLISHYPNGIYIQRSLAEWKTIPLWSEAILSGYPFGANPLAGLFYLPGWLALLFPLPLGFNIAIVIHLIFGGVGMYRLLQLEGLPDGPALLGALLFEGMPKLFSHLGAGHITLIYAVTWMPWLLYFEQLSFNKGRLRWILPGVILGSIALADIRWAAYSGLLWLAYSFKLSLEEGLLPKRPWGDWFKGHWLSSRLTNILFAGIVAAPLLLPLVEYLRLSTRSQLTAQESFILSLPPGQLLGLFYPNIGGMAEWILYPGAVGLILLILTLCNRKMLRRAGFWVGLVGVSLIFALGSNIPSLELLARLPGMDLLRVPPRTLFLTGFGFAAIAAYSLQSLIEAYLPEENARPMRGSLVLFSVTAFLVLLAAAIVVMINRANTRLQFGWGAIFLLASASIILLALKQRITSTFLTAGLLVLTLIDLSGVNALSLEFRPVSAVNAPSAALVDFLTRQEGAALYRVYSPSYSLPQNIAAVAGIQQADGVDPLQLAAYANFMEKATGVPNQGYSVTLPPYQNADPTRDNQGYHPDAVRLGLLNVKYLISEYPIRDPNFVPVAQFGETHVYQNTQALPRAWVQQSNSLPGKDILSTSVISIIPNQVNVTAQGPGELVLSELAYPGWQVSVDGTPATVDTLGDLLRGVRISSGLHYVVFRFRPLTVYVGLVLAGAGWIFLVAAILHWRCMDA